MMLVIGNGKLFTRNDEMPFVENGAVAIEGTKIAAVGETEAIKKQYGDAEFIDAKGGVIMPAFINTHEHIYSAMARGLSIKGYKSEGISGYSGWSVVDDRPPSDTGTDEIQCG